MRVPLPEGDHTLRLGFIDDEFVKTLAKEDIYKDTVNKWIGSVTVVGPFPSKERSRAARRSSCAIRRRAPAASTRSCPRWRAAPIAGP